MKIKKENLDGIIAYLQSISTTLKVNNDKLNQDYEKLNAESSPVIIKILIFLGALITTAFTIGLFSLIISMNILSIQEFTIGFGLTLIILSLTTALINTKTDFVAFFIFCVYNTGIGLFFYGINHYHPYIAYLAIIFISTITLFVYRNYLFIFTATLTIIVCKANVIALINYPYLNTLFITGVGVVTIGLLLYEAKILVARNILSRIYQPFKMAIFTGFIVLLFYFPLNYYFINAEIIDLVYKSNVNSIVVVQILSALIFFIITLYVLQKALKIMEIEYKKISLILIAFLILLPLSLFEPKINIAFLILLTCYMTNNKIGVFTGGLLVVYFIIVTYYNLEISLLYKSISMIISGIFFYTLYYFSLKSVRDEKN